MPELNLYWTQSDRKMNTPQFGRALITWKHINFHDFQLYILFP